MVVVLKLLGTALELVLLAACVHGCLTLKKHFNTTCSVADTARTSEDVVTFEFTYDKPACTLIWKSHTHVCWSMTARNQPPRDDPCEYFWSPKKDTCNPEIQIGCYTQVNDMFYLRHVVDSTLMDVKKLSGATFEVMVKKTPNVFEVRYVYFSQRQEMFPRMFDLEVEGLTLNDEEIAMNVTSHTLMMDMYYDMEYCVFNLMKGTVSLALGRNITKNRPNEPCVRAIFVARKSIDGLIVSLSFTEKGGCQRSGRTTQFGLLLNMSTDMMLTESTAEPSSSSLPHIQCWSVFIGFILVCSL